MKKLKKKMSVLALLVSCLTLAFGSVPAFADVDAATQEMLSSSVGDFLSQVYTLDDSQLQQLDQQGGFYEVFYESWEEDRDIVGDFEKVESTEVSESDDQIVTTSLVKFKNYEAEVQIYFDEDNSQPTPKNYVMNIKYSMGELMGQAAENMAVGLITVFCVLAILIILMLVEGKIFQSIDKKKSKKAQSDAEETAVPGRSNVTRTNASAATAAPAAAATGKASDEEIAAVIAAAIAAAMEETPSPSGYVVRSVRRVGDRKWRRV